MTDTSGSSSAAKHPSLRVALVARYVPGESGGIEVASLAAINALQHHGRDRYQAVLPAGDVPEPGPPVRDLLRRSAGLRRAVGLARKLRSRSAPLEPAVLAFDPHVIHFLTQDASIVDRPSVYQPWDLQHRHLPEFFSAAEVRRRDRLYRLHCERATAVVVPAQPTAVDVMRSFDVPASKVFVVAPPSPRIPERSAAQVRATIRGFGLERPFAIYPARTWAHKNHVRLIAAWSQILDIGLDLVLVGGSGGADAQIDAEIAERGLRGSVHRLGALHALQVADLYRGAALLVFPSLFEGWGLPVREAASIGLAVAVALRVPAADDLDPVIRFDPRSVESIAEGVRMAASAPPALVPGPLSSGSPELFAATIGAIHARCAGRARSVVDDGLLRDARPRDG